MTFNELVIDRKEWVKISQKNKFDFDSILAGLYNDPSHFIFELLQNAEDECASEVKFELYNDRLDFYHNGEDFNIKDIESITGIGISTKRDDLTAIGKFGLGFKSVFAITESPIIHSGDFNIKIEDFVVPSMIEPVQLSYTLIRLPFNHSTRKAQDVFDMLSEKLRNVNLKSMLFLRNIREIKWSTPIEEGHYLSESKVIEDNSKRVTIMSSDISENYVVFEKSIEIQGKENKVEVAYRLGKDKDQNEIILPVDDSNLIVFFPTEKETNLNFVIQGPYKTTPNRENIPFNDPDNMKILNETGNLIADSLTFLKYLGYLDVNLLTLLPLKPNDTNIIYKNIYECIKLKLQQDELLPTYDNKFSNANSVILARGEELPGFLSNEDIYVLFEKNYWLNTKITYDRTRDLRDYLINELGIKEVDFGVFANKITKDFLSTKSDEWIVSFYDKLLNQSSLWNEKGLLRRKPIIRLNDDEHIEPFDNNGNIQVYLPSETNSDYPTVKKEIVNNKEALTFLKNLGLSEPDLFAEIKEYIIPRYSEGKLNSYQSYLIDLEKMISCYESTVGEKKTWLISALKNIPIVLCQNSLTKQDDFQKPNNAYFKTNSLIEYFDGVEKYFVSDDILDHFKQVSEFLGSIGVSGLPRRLSAGKKPLNLDWNEKRRYTGNTGRDVYYTDFELDGLADSLKSITESKSKIIWNILLKHIEPLNSWNAKDFFFALKEWDYQYSRSVKHDSGFLKLLKNESWLFDSNGNPKTSKELSMSQLPDGYIKDAPNIEVLKEVLDFKEEILEQLPEFEREVINMIKSKYNITSLDELENILKVNKSVEKKEWIPEYLPDEVEPIITQPELEIIQIEDLGNQSLVDNDTPENGKGNKDDENNNGHSKNTEPKQQNKLDIISVGQWGEQIVYNELLKIHKDAQNIEIVLLNQYGNRGKGYDIVVRENGNDKEFIEVKTKTENGREFIGVTGVQWEFARNLFNKGEGNKYFFYIVENAGQKNPSIKIIRNPIKEWKEGKLYAHPVNFGF